ncbi:TraP protein (plasmid) [Klebsiella sp. RHBSTW-00465]|uniref:conjugal transfer protein TraP n=1 Tax=Klebsiella sp. RHBSTW-00465 TaxID=2742650 RepID=UPI0015F5586D|nr:conjugal transfer protein TraP [Klebsiella sp. RHBSTW-00465]MBA7848634.1 TraP protein [Klebsiella sp. RHBSTW-00465]
MVKSLITLVLSSLRWFRWLFQYAVVYPLAMMALLVFLVFWKGPYTPGQTLVKTIESVQREGYVIHDCTGPASRGELKGGEAKPLLPPPPALKEDCTSVSTDAAGYAAHIDHGYTKNILWLWFLMAVVFTGVAVVFGRTPASRTGITWVRGARGNVFPGCRPGKGAISPLLAGYQRRGETIVIYDPSARFSEEDKNENKEK